jgi:hypothetical protein
MQSNGLFGIVLMAQSLINSLLPFIITLTIFYFIWGLFKLVRSGDGEGREEALGYVTWGVIALFVMVSVWGLVNILVRSFNLNNSTPPLPQVMDVQ